MIYTDGITEARNEEHEPFGEARLLTLLQIAGGSGLLEVLAAIAVAIAAINIVGGFMVTRRMLNMFQKS